MGFSTEIFDVEKTDRDFVYNLKNSSKDIKVVLDCASFIHSLGIQRSSKIHQHHLSTKECWDIFKYLNVLPKERRCLDYNENRFKFSDCLN
ncbi:MAG: hypothetical protein ACPGJV_04760 [Bacteriovoracaceae bacterium]